jgi:hypothetical protein
MTRPRTPYGIELPGRLAATMIKVLAAEMSDPGRLSRGKRYWAESAVVDIDIEPGVVVARVQGARPAPYRVQLNARPGAQAPSRSEVTVRCNCPDDDGSGRWACKHSVAALFALADQIAIDPAVLEQWRGGTASPVGESAHQPDGGKKPAGGEPDGGEPEDSEEPDDERRARSGSRALEPAHDRLGGLLSTPGGCPLPAIPVFSDAAHPRFPDRLTAEVLRDALEHLLLRWE